MINNLSNVLNRELLKSILIKNNINLNVRAEELKLENFLEIYNKVFID